MSYILKLIILHTNTTKSITRTMPSYRALYTRRTHLSSKIPITQSTQVHSNPTNTVLFNREKNINLAFKTIEHKESRYGYHPKLMPLTRNCLDERGRRRQHRGEAGRGP